MEDRPIKETMSEPIPSTLLRSLCYRLLNLSLLLALSLVNALPATAAERVILKYKILRESISVEDLSALAREGEVSSSLNRYLKMANTQPEELQEALNEEIKVDAVSISKFLNSYPGEFLLDGASEVIHTPSKSASRQSLRGALVTSAVPDNNVRLIEVIENYPTREVDIEGDRLVELYNTLDNVLGKLSRLGL
jgi:hypothetical protein